MKLVKREDDVKLPQVVVMQDRFEDTLDVQ